MSTEHPNQRHGDDVAAEIFDDFGVMFEMLADRIAGVLAREDDLSDESRGELERLCRWANASAAGGAHRADERRARMAVRR